MKRRAHWIGVMFTLLASAWLVGHDAVAQDRDEPKFGRPHIDAARGSVKVLDDVKIVDFGKVIFEGKIDLNPTLDRIRKGESLKHRNDGAIFMNREGRLPRHKEREYYREFVFQKKGLPFPGPTRVIIGAKGEVYFTGDHYETFKRAN